MSGKKKTIQDAVDSAQQLWSSVKLSDQTVVDVADKVTKLADTMSSKATQQWDKLEQVFEERVARALSRLGVPSQKDMNQLIKRVDELSAKIAKLTDKPTRTKQTPPAKRATRTKKTAA